MCSTSDDQHDLMNEELSASSGVPYTGAFKGTVDNLLEIAKTAARFSHG